MDLLLAFGGMSTSMKVLRILPLLGLLPLWSWARSAKKERLQTQKSS